MDSIWPVTELIVTILWITFMIDTRGGWTDLV